MRSRNSLNWNLLGRDQVDLKAGAQPGGQIVGQVAREQIVQHADGAQLLVRDLPGRGEVVGHHARPAPRRCAVSGAVLRAASKSASISSCFSVFSINCPLSRSVHSAPSADPPRSPRSARLRARSECAAAPPGRCSAARRCTTAEACTCETRDSTTPSARPISRMVISS